MANTWNKSGTTWGYNSWQSDTVKPTITGQAATASVGSLTAYNEAGWGSDEVLVKPSGVEATALLGINTWGNNTWGNGAWQAYTIETAIGVPLSGLSTTASVGKIYPPEQPQGLSVTASLGSLSINNGADHTQGLSGQSVTASVGSFGYAWIDFPSGVSATASIGSLTISSVELIDVTGVSATASVGSISPTEMSIGLTGVAATASVGSISPTQMTVGLTGVSATATVANLTTSSGGGIFAYADIDTGSNVTYTDVTTP